MQTFRLHTWQRCVVSWSLLLLTCFYCLCSCQCVVVSHCGWHVPVAMVLDSHVTMIDSSRCCDGNSRRRRRRLLLWLWTVFSLALLYAAFGGRQCYFVCVELILLLPLGVCIYAVLRWAVCTELKHDTLSRPTSGICSPLPWTLAANYAIPSPPVSFSPLLPFPYSSPYLLWGLAL